MGKNKQETKSTDKGSGGKGGKGKGKADDEKDTKSSKGAQSINVRHILVSPLTYHPHFHMHKRHLLHSPCVTV